MSKIGRNDSCPCGSGRKYKKCCLDSGVFESPGAPAKRAGGAGGLTLVLETDAGTLYREIPPAMPLRLTKEQGKAAEDATHSAASLWGMPDFVFKPEVLAVGSGVRELGDGILVLGDLGLVLQVKCRDNPGDKTDREKHWIAKHTAKALRQGRGTIRNLTAASHTLTNMRSREVEISGAERQWVTVVILDHERPPDNVTFPGSQIQDAGVLLRRDWEFLFDQLKSTHAVAAYLRRVAGEDVELGAEPVRYHRLATLDSHAGPRGLDSAIKELGAAEYWEPMLPLTPVGSEDEGAHRFFRSILEDIATIELQTTTEQVRVRALAELDRLPTEHRAHIGNYLREAFNLVSRPDRAEGVFRLKRILGGLGSTQLLFGAGAHFPDDNYQEVFASWVELRHQEFIERIGKRDEEAISIGVLLTPRSDELIWDTTLTAIFGPIEIGPDRRALLEEAWGDEKSAMLETVGGSEPTRLSRSVGP
jgi:hypothetical protein